VKGRRKREGRTPERASDYTIWESEQQSRTVRSRTGGRRKFHHEKSEGEDQRRGLNDFLQL